MPKGRLDFETNYKQTKKILTFALLVSFLTQFGTRVQNMDDVIEQLISQVRRRHKRSLWESALSWFGEEIKEEEESLGQVPTKHSTRPATSYRRRSRATGHSSRPFTSRPTSHPTGPSTRPRPTYASADGGETVSFLFFLLSKVQNVETRKTLVSN